MEREAGGGDAMTTPYNPHTVYVCAPFRGDGSPEAMRRNTARAEEAAATLRTCGMEPVVPHTQALAEVDAAGGVETAELRSAGMAQSLATVRAVIEAGGRLVYVGPVELSPGCRAEAEEARRLRPESVVLMIEAEA